MNNTFIKYSKGPSGAISRLIIEARSSAEDENTMAYAELLHDLYCHGEHINDDIINEGYCPWLDEELEDEWFDSWGRNEHIKWSGIAERFISAGIDPETAVKHSGLFQS